MAYDQLQPFGSERDNWHAAVNTQMLAAIYTKKGKQPPKVSDFMYKNPEEKQKQTEQSFVAWLRGKAKNGN